MTHYIAVDEDLSTGAIYGIGDTEEAALADANRGEPSGTYRIVPATERLVNDVETNGGGPGDVQWTFENGLADLDV